MKKSLKLVLGFIALLGLSACSAPTESSKEAGKVEQQQGQYAKGQPVVAFDYYLEQELVNQLYTIRNQSVLTHSIWRSDYGQILGDCSSMGYGLPYDISLTNPLKAVNRSGSSAYTQSALTSIEQPEPNGIFASKNTNATWVMCLGDEGDIDPIYVEAKVNVYPYDLTVDYSTGRVTKQGVSHVSINIQTLVTQGVATKLRLE